MPEFPEIPSGEAMQSGDFVIGYRSSTDYRFPFDNFFDNVTTTSISEGTGLYYTDERVDDRVGVLIQDGTGISWVYDDGAGTLTPTVSISPFDTTDLAENASANHYVQPASVTLDNDEIKACNGSPIPIANGLLDTGDPAKGYILYGVVASSDITTTGYTNSGIDIVDKSTGNILFELPSSLISGTSAMAVGMPVSSGVIITAGGGISVKAKSADPTVGDAPNTLTIRITFAVHDFI